MMSSTRAAADHELARDFALVKTSTTYLCLCYLQQHTPLNNNCDIEDARIRQLTNNRVNKMAQECKATKLRDQIYFSEDANETTFMFDDSLPSLPLPTLEASVQKLLDTIKPIVESGGYAGLNERAWVRTQRKAYAMLSDADALELQRLLELRAKERKNWLEDWWLEFAYLRSRKSLSPFSNMAAPLPLMAQWPPLEGPFNEGSPNEGGRRRRVALAIFFFMTFWRMLRLERARTMSHKGAAWSMNQFRYLFSSTRSPGEFKDDLRTWFKTKREGPVESCDIIIFHKGHVFAIKPVHIDAQTGEECILSAPDIERQLEFIEKWAQDKPAGPGVGSLCTQDRDQWFRDRSRLEQISARNKEILSRIDRCLTVYAFSEAAPDNYTDMLRLAMCGDPRDKWPDKSVLPIAFKNGTFGATADHTPYDGLCTGLLTHFLMMSIEGCKGEWQDELGIAVKSSLAKYVEPEIIDFDVDEVICRNVQLACDSFERIAQSIDVLYETFGHFGKAAMKKCKLHPEAFIQCAVHAAYFKQHRRMAPAYVTASTRRFHNGRTETCRSCFPEMHRFARNLCEIGLTNPKQTLMYLKMAAQKQQQLMDEASAGYGCDRHLLGLYLTAVLEGRPIPELLEDELVQRTNNYVLSMSCSGYWCASGGVPPYVEEGYGVFYAIEQNEITFCMSSFNSCPDTDLKKFYETLTQTMIDMQTICLSV